MKNAYKVLIGVIVIIVVATALILFNQEKDLFPESQPEKICLNRALANCETTGEMPSDWESSNCAELIDCICEDSQLRCAEPV